MSTMEFPIRKRVRGGPLMSCQVTDVDTTGDLKTIHGRAVPYKAWALRGYFLLSMAEGCFDKSIQESGQALPLLLFHDAESFPIGKAAQWESRPDGLWGTWDLTNDAKAQRAAQLARDGVLTGLSVSWQPVLQDWEIQDPAAWNPDDTSTMDRCTLKEGRLIETSLTPIPNFVDAGVASVAAQQQPPRSQLDRWKDWRANLSP
jgi:HK97 family phage prohead protease